MDQHNPHERDEVGLSSSAAIAFVCISGFFCFLLLLAYCRCYCMETHRIQAMRFFKKRKPNDSLLLPVVFYRRKAKEDFSTPHGCVVCLSDFEDKEPVKVVPGCGHVFHPQCIDGWLVVHRSCPVCRCSDFSGEKGSESDEEEAIEWPPGSGVVRMGRSRSWCYRDDDHGGELETMGMRRRTCSF